MLLRFHTLPRVESPKAVEAALQALRGLVPQVSAYRPPLKGAHDPHVGWLVATAKRGGRGATRPSKINNNLGRETVN